jgi:hypothetical protein
MDKQSNQQHRDANRKAHFIDTHVFQYVTDAVFKAMVDGTVYFTSAEQEASQRIIGGVYAKNGQLIGL